MTPAGAILAPDRFRMVRIAETLHNVRTSIREHVTARIAPVIDTQGNDKENRT